MIFKRHWLIWVAYICISAIGLVTSLSISSALDLWGLTYSVILTSPLVGLAWYLRFLNESKLQALTSIEEKPSKKKINRVSLTFSIISGVTNVAPALIVIVLYAYKINVFNPYMLIALYIAYFIVFIASTIFEQKQANKQPQPQ